MTKHRTCNHLGVCQAHVGPSDACRYCPGNPYFGYPGGRPVWPEPLSKPPAEAGRASGVEPVEPRKKQ